MKAIQIMMDEGLLRQLDEQAKRRKTDRSKLLRLAATRYLAELRRKDLEDRHRRGYGAKPQTADEIEPWQEIEAWPET